tara:strand:+ start:312 stop:1619 length:1308 start_codon:yes stop_codon:yes gene_type:complete
MANKKEKKIDINDVQFLFLSFLIIIYFFYGFFTNENSAGAGGYTGDFKLIWSNLLLLKEGLFTNIDNPAYNDSRSPLSYILHILLNPFIDNKHEFRNSTFVISLIIPYLLFLAIKENFKKLRFSITLLLAVTVTLSPYFRTTAYWSLGENYAIIFLLLTYLFYTKLINSFNTFNERQKNFYISILCFLSSIIVYFDQKLVFIPFLVLYLILNLRLKTNLKFFTFFYFFILSLPYFYLIFLWQGLIPTDANTAREVGTKLHLFHPGFCLLILFTAVFPFIFLKKLSLEDLKEKLFLKKNIYLSYLFFSYVIVCLFFGNFENLRIEGKGAFHKISLLLIEDASLRLFITTVFFLISFIFILITFESLNDRLILLFLILSSLFIFPFYQEYLDPLIYILIFSFFKSKFEIIKVKSIYFLIFYYFLFSLSAKYYYSIII